MPKIDFTHESAPLSGGQLPTIKQIADLQEKSDVYVWVPPPRCPPKHAMKWLPVAIGLSIAVSFVTLIFTESKPKITKIEDKVITEKKLPSSEGVQSITAVIANPGQEVLEYLAKLEKSGCTVQLITLKKIAATYTVSEIPEDYFKAEGFILNGFMWAAY